MLPLLLSSFLCTFAQASSAKPFEARDVFELEWADDPAVSPDGRWAVFARKSFDVMSDAPRSSLWIVELATGETRPLLAEEGLRAGSPRWSPSGDRLLYLAAGERGARLTCRWMESGASAVLAHTEETPGGIAWSPDGHWIAFHMFVPAKPAPLAELPEPPEGAEWAEPPRVIERVIWRADGEGILPEGYAHAFVLPAQGGTKACA